jgi:hypothetical protein
LSFQFEGCQVTLLCKTDALQAWETVTHHND